ncbi:hypothetical protein D3C87_1374820 [compost metagenome]
MRAHDAIIAVVVFHHERQCIDKTVIRCHARFSRFQDPPDLGGQHEFVAWFPLKKIPEAAFGKALPVIGCGIEIADAGVPGGLQRLHRIFAADAAIEITDTGRAEGKLAQRQRRATKFAGFHAVPSSRRSWRSMVRMTPRSSPSPFMRPM